MSVGNICPATEMLAADKDKFSTTDRVFLSLAELNGYIDGIPKLTFRFGRSDLDAARRSCLRLLGTLYVGAIKHLGLKQSDRDTVGLRVIGHSDAVDGPDKNLKISYLRASREGNRLRSSIAQGLGWSAKIEFEGRGERELWWCGAGTENCVFSDSSGAPGAIVGPEVRVDNDRRLEIRFIGASIAGPRLASILKSLPTYARVPQEVRSRFVERPRYFPVGTAPLQPVELQAGPELRFKGGKTCKATETFYDSGWIAGPTSGASKLEPKGAEKPRAFDEANIAVRLSLVPYVTAGEGSPDGARLILRMATSLIAPVAPPAVAAGAPAGASPLQANEAAARPDAMALPRAALGLGVPAYWRARLRLDEMLATVTLPAELLDLLKQCWKEKKKVAALSQQMLIRQVQNEALEALPVDFDGLLGQAYDFNRPTRMFGLRAGHVLRISAGRPGPLAGKTLGVAQNLSAFPDVQELELFAAPLAIANISSGGAGPLSSASWPAGSGPYGHLAVTLDPAQQSIWQETQRKTDLESDQLPRWAADKEKIAHLANQLSLERFLRGRVVRVFSPGPASHSDGKLSISEERLDLTPHIVDEKLDTVLVAAESPEILDAFAQAYGGRDLVGDDKPLCKEASFETQVLCGYFRHNVLLGLMVQAQIDGRARKVPVDTRISALMTSASLERCFTGSGGMQAADAAFVPFDLSHRLAKGIQIEALGAGRTRPAFYDRTDCRLLALPVLEGGRVTW